MDALIRGALEENTIRRNDSTPSVLFEVVHEYGFRHSRERNRKQGPDERAHQATHDRADTRTRHQGNERECWMDVNRISHELRR